jgi:hypothetical protein
VWACSARSPRFATSFPVWLVGGLCNGLRLWAQIPFQCWPFSKAARLTLALPGSLVTPGTVPKPFS